jgi:4-carboxymuconolactone decarboxylase
VRRQDEDLLRRLALHDEGMLESRFGPDVAEVEGSGLDAKTLALVRLAGLVAVEAAPASYQWIVASALAAGASEAEIVEVVAALVPIVGTVRTSSAAPEVGLAIGCDLGSSEDR